MRLDIKVWDANHDQVGDVVIAEFAEKADAVLFARAKAKREGGFVSTLWVGSDYETREQVSVV